MAIVVEDGTARADAETYISVADADAYHSARANSAWAGYTTGNKEAYLRRAAEFMTGEYRRRWTGTRLTATQALDWPRAFVPRQDYYNLAGTPPDSANGEFYYPSDEVPVEVQRACAELALRAANGALRADTERAVRREKVDVLEVEYEPGAADKVAYNAIDAMLSVFLRSSSAIRLVRA